MRYDRGDSFAFDFEPNGISFGSKSKGKLSNRDHISFNVKGNGNTVYSAQDSCREGATRRGSLPIRVKSAEKLPI